MKYDPLIRYLEKHSTCPLTTALELLDEYDHDASRYQIIYRLVQRKRIERIYIDEVEHLRLRINARKTPQAIKPSMGHDNNLEDIAAFYRYFIRYGAQHFSAPGRVKFMSIMKIWLSQRKELIYFVDALREIIDNPPSKAEFLAIEKGLDEAGWYQDSYDAVSRIDTIIGKLNPNQLSNFMGISDETWSSLHDYDGLGRINPGTQTQSIFSLLTDRREDQILRTLLEEGPQPNQSYQWTGFYMRDWKRDVPEDEKPLVQELWDAVNKAKNIN